MANRIFIHWDKDTRQFHAGWNPPADVDYSKILEIEFEEGERPELLVAGEELDVL